MSAASGGGGRAGSNEDAYDTLEGRLVKSWSRCVTVAFELMVVLSLLGLAILMLFPNFPRIPRLATVFDDRFWELLSTSLPVAKDL